MNRKIKVHPKKDKKIKNRKKDKEKKRAKGKIYNEKK